MFIRQKQTVLFFEQNHFQKPWSISSKTLCVWMLTIPMIVLDRDHGRLVLSQSFIQLVLHKQQRARETMAANKDLKSNKRET